MQYERNTDANPGDGQTEDQADTIKNSKRRSEPGKLNLSRLRPRRRPAHRTSRGRPLLIKVHGREQQHITQSRLRHSIPTSGHPADPLDPRFDLEKHSPNGFEWGTYQLRSRPTGPGHPCHNTGNDNYALAYHQDFKRDVISKLPFSAPWTMEEEQVTGWVKDHRLVSPREFQETVR